MSLCLDQSLAYPTFALLLWIGLLVVAFIGHGDLCGGASNGRVALLQEAIFNEPQEFAVPRGRRDRGRREGGV